MIINDKFHLSFVLVCLFCTSDIYDLVTVCTLVNFACFLSSNFY